MTSVYRISPVGFTFNYDTALCQENATAHLKNAGVEVKIGAQAGTFVDHNHNLATQRFLDSGCDFLWWLDSDMLFPGDTPIRLLNCASALAGVVYRRRMAPNDLMGVKLEPRRFFVREDEGIHDAWQLGTGCLIVHRSVYTGAINSLKYPWYQNVYGEKLADFEGGDTVFVRRAVQAGHKCRAELYVSRDVYHTGNQAHGWFDFDDVAVRAAQPADQCGLHHFNHVGEVTFPTPAEAYDAIS